MSECIIQISDPQLGFFEENASFTKEITHLNLAIAHINAVKPSLVVFSGDLVHAHPDNPLYPLQAEAFLETLQALDSSIPILITNGNHDIGNQPSDASIKLFQSFFGQELNYWSNSQIEVITFNSQLFARNVQLEKHQKYAFEWLQRLLAQKKQSKLRFLFMHHPLYLQSIEEESSYFSVAKPHRKRLLNLIADGRVDACFSGHLHYNHQIDVHGIPFITTASLGKPLGKDPSGFRKIEYNKAPWSHQYFPLESAQNQSTI